ncbi:MAG: DUF192 domain-containing protein [Sphingopyxis sp.]|nr:DUF192 domain-containing protein [Sphingopyxis sp.]
MRTKEYRFPIDILWVDESHHVVHMLEHAEPCAQDPCPPFGAATRLCSVCDTGRIGVH